MCSQNKADGIQQRGLRGVRADEGRRQHIDSHTASKRATDGERESGRGQFHADDTLLGCCYCC